LLKLHGTVAWPNEPLNDTHRALNPHCAHKEFFHHGLPRRIEALTAECGKTETPILFPWEVFAADGNFLTPDNFALRDQVIQNRDTVFRHGGRLPTDPCLNDIFKAIWMRARREVQAAREISFVGISMHEYLSRGLKYLFAGENNLSPRVTITDRQSLGRTRNTYEASSPTGRLAAMRDMHFPRFQYMDPVIRTDFAEFITKDL
jgi:hypothetical protein